MTTRKLQNPQQKTRHGIFYSSAPIRATMLPKKPFSTEGPIYFLSLNCRLKKCFVVTLYEVEHKHQYQLLTATNIYFQIHFFQISIKSPSEDKTMFCTLKRGWNTLFSACSELYVVKKSSNLQSIVNVILFHLLFVWS